MNGRDESSLPDSSLSWGFLPPHSNSANIHEQQESFLLESFKIQVVLMHLFKSEIAYTLNMSAQNSYVK